MSAQKIGVVDTDYILSKMPQYKEAQDRLNAQIANWQTEIQTLQSEFDKKKSLLENERVLLVGDQLKQREKEVDDLDKKIKNMINNRFGTLGEINSARSNLTKPFQDQIWNAIRTVSEKNTLGIVLDKSNNISVIFLDKRYDYTDKVLDLLLKNSGNKDRKIN
ncbi:MAG: OmpH family outer membrane protein [Kaistella sp.]